MSGATRDQFKYVTQCSWQLGPMALSSWESLINWQNFNIFLFPNSQDFFPATFSQPLCSVAKVDAKTQTCGCSAFWWMLHRVRVASGGIMPKFHWLLKTRSLQILSPESGTTGLAGTEGLGKSLSVSGFVYTGRVSFHQRRCVMKHPATSQRTWCEHVIKKAQWSICWRKTLRCAALGV